jgi:hypothetical protein
MTVPTMLALGAACCAVLWHVDLRASSAAGGALVHRMLEPAVPKLVTYRARRTLAASTRGGRMRPEVAAWTSIDHAGVFDYNVISATGSGLIRDHVLLKALETERRTHNERTGPQLDLTPENYEFGPEEAGTDDLARIPLRARRTSQMLLNGFVTVTRGDADIVRVDGRLSQTPSWWTRRVDIVRRYARIAGVRVPIEMSSRADVRMVGESTFVMTYDYETINAQLCERGETAAVQTGIRSTTERD